MVHLSTAAHKGTEQIFVGRESEDIAMDVLPPGLVAVVHHCSQGSVKQGTAQLHHISAAQSNALPWSSTLNLQTVVTCTGCQAAGQTCGGLCTLCFSCCNTGLLLHKT